MNVTETGRSPFFALRRLGTMRLRRCFGYGCTLHVNGERTARLFIAHQDIMPYAQEGCVRIVAWLQSIRFITLGSTKAVPSVHVRRPWFWQLLALVLN